LKIILRIFFGSVDEGLGREISEIFSREIYRDFSSWGPWTRFGHLQPRLRGLIDEEVRRRRAQPDAESITLLGALIEARSESGAFLDDAEIQDHLFTMLVGGADPTALALSWTLYWIHEVPQALAHLRRELAEFGPELDPRRVAELPYLNAVCLESLRMYPVVTTPTGRKLLVTATVQGRSYEPGVTLLPCPYLVHRRPDLFPEPARFQPERFLKRQYAPHEYFPFGGGARTCIGSALAPLEMKLVLAEILAHCHLIPAHDGPVRPARHGTLLAPSDAMKFLLAGSPDFPGGDAR
jgi:unspecific monooxygenase